MAVRQGGRYRVDPATGERRRIDDEPAAVPAPAEPKPEIPSRARARESKKSEE